MNDDPLDDLETSSGTVFRDVIMLALAGFVALVVLLLPHLNPPTTDAEAAVPMPGNVMVEARWPDDLDADVDLWVQAPGDVPVGYSNKSGLIFNLLRDDLGRMADPTALNYEISYSRGIPPGEYTVNLHLYRNKARVYPVPVTVVVSAKSEQSTQPQRVVSSDVKLVFLDQEMTVFRFHLDEHGNLVPGSVGAAPKPLRSGAKG